MAADGGRLSSPSALDGEATPVCATQVRPAGQEGHRETGEDPEMVTKVIKYLERTSWQSWAYFIY